MEDDIAKGKSIVNQLLTWDMLLETRIKLQKLLVTANRLPQHTTCNALESCRDERLVASKSAAITELDKLNKSLNLLLRYMNPHKSLQLQEQPTKSEDSEIESENDEIEEDLEVESHKSEKKQVANNFGHQDLVNARNRVLEYWYQKTRYANVGKRNKNNMEEFEESIVKVIDRILENRQRLVDRTRTKRSEYQVVGKTINEHSDSKETEDQDDDTQLDNDESKDPEIFDDDDFYHQLLREIIESKAANVNDPVALSQKWLEIQKLRSKMKKKVDTRATKGRKIKHNVHPKLLNFMTPATENSEASAATDELFSSLFGQRKHL